MSIACREPVKDDSFRFTRAWIRRIIAFWQKIGFKYSFRFRLHNPGRYHFFFNAGKETLFSYWYWPDRKLQPPQSHHDPHHAGFYHLAFHVDTEDELDEIHMRLNRAGIKVSEITGRHLFAKSFYFEDPDGIRFEFACPVLRFTGDIDHDGEGKGTPLSADAKLGNRRLDGAVQFETKYK